MHAGKSEGAKIFPFPFPFPYLSTLLIPFPPIQLWKPTGVL